MVGLVESIQQLVEKQQLRPGSKRPRQQSEPPLTVGKSEKAAPSQRLDPQPPQDRAHAPAIGIARRVKWNVCAVDARGDDLLDRMVPPVARILVLALRSDVSDLVLHLVWCTPDIPLPTILARPVAWGRRPYGAGDELQELRLSGTVRSGQHPALARADRPAHPLEDSAPIALEAHPPEPYFDVTGLLGPVPAPPSRRHSPFKVAPGDLVPI